MSIAHVDVLPDRGFEGLGAAVRAAAELLLREEAEPAFDEIDPGCADGREVQMVARPLRQPVRVRGVLCVA
jgi:hypothetical protein